MVMRLQFGISLISLLCNVLLSFAKKDTELYCAVCRALVDEINYSISQVDPKQKVQVGSFRVDSKGNQKTYEVPLGRSEVHLTEVFETVCEKFRSYGFTKNEAGKKSIVRMTSRDNKPLVLKDIQITHEGMKQITFTCDSVVEEHEDDMIALFRKDLPDVDKQICVDTTELCTLEDMDVPMPEPGPVREDPPPTPPNEKTDDEEDDEEDNEEDKKDEDDEEFVDLPDIDDSALKDLDELSKDEL